MNKADMAAHIQYLQQQADRLKAELDAIHADGHCPTRAACARTAHLYHQLLVYTGGLVDLPGMPRQTTQQATVIEDADVFGAAS